MLTNALLILAVLLVIVNLWRGRKSRRGYYHPWLVGDGRRPFLPGHKPEDEGSKRARPFLPADRLRRR